MPPVSLPPPEEQVRTDPQVPVFPSEHERRGFPFPFPWGLVVAWAVYGLLVLGYTWATYWRSAEYQAAVHYRDAHALLGASGGRQCSRAELEEAYLELVEAARLKPEVKTLHEELEDLNWRFDERHWEVPEHLRNSAEAVAAIWMEIQKANAPILVVGMRDRGWAPDQLVEGPARTLRWSPLGLLLIAVIWAYGRFNAKRQREEEKERERRAIEAELAERDRERARAR